MKNENSKVTANEAEAVSQKASGAVSAAEVKSAEKNLDEVKMNDIVNLEADELDEELEDDFDDDELLDEEIPEVRLELQRERFVGKDKTGKKQRFWTYFIKGTVYGKDVRSNFEAADKGGYELLSMLFDWGSKVVVTYIEEKMTDSKSGAVSTYGVYNASAVAPDGNVVEYKIKPMRPSDKSIFMMLYNAEKARIIENK